MAVVTPGGAISCSSVTKIRRSHAGAGINRSAQCGLCSETAAQVAQHVAGMPEANVGSTRDAAQGVSRVRHHDDALVKELRLWVSLISRLIAVAEMPGRRLGARGKT